MKKSSLLKKYKKALRENTNASEETKRHIKQNYVTKLFFRIFLSSLILLICVIYDSVFVKNNKRYKGAYFMKKMALWEKAMIEDKEQYQVNYRRTWVCINFAFSIFFCWVILYRLQ